jgi:mitochondrial fission protein ELM1
MTIRSRPAAGGSPGEADAAHTRRAPFVWAITHRRCGDNEQTLALAESLRWPFSTIELGEPAFRTRLLDGLRAAWRACRSDPETRPQPSRPDLVICCGLDAEQFARSIRRAAGPANTQLVYIGRPRSRFAEFSLVLSTPQYALPARPNIVQLELPLHRALPERIAAARAAWAPRFAHLPRPHIALLVGGSTGPFALDTRAAARLGRRASARARATGGSLLVTTSFRTQHWVTAALLDHLDAPAHIHRWSRNAAENPYLAYLGLADEIIVTGDSMSMLSESAATGKPLHIFDLGEGAYAMRLGAPLGRELWRRPQLLARMLHFKAVESLMPPDRRRDIRRILAPLVASGRAAWLGDPLPALPSVPLSSGLEEALRRIRGWFEPTEEIDMIASLNF